MATTIKIKNSVTATTTPTSLVQGEVAINVTDKKVWVGNAATTPIQIVGAGTTGNAAGSNNQVQYNSSGSFAGDADFTFNGTTVTMANDASISGLTVGKGGGAVVSNTVLGVSAGTSNTTGAYNTFVGGQDAVLSRAAGQLNTTGSINTAIGSGALGTNTTGSNNTAIGYRSLAVNTAGDNTALGAYSLLANTTGANNVALGRDALTANTTASNNTAVGYQAGYTNSTGTEDTFLGKGAGYSNTTGSYNFFAGFHAGYFNTTGNYNTYVGHASGPVTTAGATGSNNTTLGYGALNANTSASNNTAVGYQAGYAVTTGTITAFGSSAGVALTTGTDNTFIGKSAGNAITTGTTNTFVGFEAGGNTTTGVSGSVCLGRDAGYGLAATNTLYIARDNVGAGNAGCWIFGSSAGACNQGNNSSSWTTTSDERVKNILGASTKGLAEIMQIEVKNFKYKSVDELPAFVFNEQGIPVVSPDSENVYTGATAQQVQTPFPESVKAGEQGVLTVDTDPIFWAMIKAIQELKAEVDSLKQQLGK